MAISEAPLLFRALIITGVTVGVLIFFIGAMQLARKSKKGKESAPKWVDWLSRGALVLIAGSFFAVSLMYAAQHWLDYAKKDYCVYTGSYTVKEIKSEGRSKAASYVAVLPDGHQIDISMGNVGYTTGTLVYTARTNILLGYDDSVVIQSAD